MLYVYIGLSTNDKLALSLIEVVCRNFEVELERRRKYHERERAVK